MALTDGSTSAEFLARHNQISARLQLEIMDIQDDISRLKAELRRDQDPSKMGRIQSQIGVCLPPIAYEPPLMSNIGVDAAG
jgi:hypothetical protein